jgi:hypothetical protein
MVIFTTELAVMEIFSPLFSHLGRLLSALVDATLLVVLASIPLWILFSPVFTGRLRRDDGARRDLGRAFIRLVTGFFTFELLIMLCLPALLPDSDSTLLALVDAGLAAMLTAPLLWWLLVGLERAHRQLSLADLLESPILLYLLVLYVVFLSSILQELISIDEILDLSGGPHHVIESLVLMLITTPFLWLFVARPLRRSVQSERMRARAVYEQVIDAVVLTDIRGLIIALNPAAQRIFGYAEVELVGQPAGVLFKTDR